MRSRSAEDTFSKWLGRSEPLKGLWVCIADDLEQPGSDGRQLILCCDSEEG